MWMSVEMAFAGINIAVMYFFVRAILKDRRELHFTWKVFVIVVVFLIRFFSNYFFNHSILILSGASLIIAFLIGMVCFRTKMHVVVLATTFFWIAGTITELLSAFLITIIQPVPTDVFMQHGIHRFQGRTVSYLCLLAIITPITRFRRGSINVFDFKTAMGYFILPLVSMLFAYQYVVHVTLYGYILTINDAFTLFSIIFVNVIIFILAENLIKQNEKDRMLILLKAQDEIKNNHIVQIMENQNQIRKMSHDFKHHIETLIALCVSKNYDKLLGNLYELSGKKSGYILVDSGNIMLDAILSSKKNEAQNYNISFELDMNIPKNHPRITMELCTLLGNGLDNAIEACIRSKKEDKFVKVKINANMSQFECYIKNTIDKKPQPDGKFFKTSKLDPILHGIGLRSMKQTCDALGGKIDLDYNDKHFECHIYLPLKIQN